MAVSLGGEPAAQRERRRAVGLHLGADVVQMLRGRGDRDEAVVLGGRPDQCRPAYVDILDAGLFVRAGGHRLRERVEIDDQQVDGPDAVRVHGLHMGRVVAQPQQPAMQRRMQRLDPPVQHFGETRPLRDLHDGDAGRAQLPGRAAGGEDFDAALRKKAPERLQPRLVGHGNKGAANGYAVAGGQGGGPPASRFAAPDSTRPPRRHAAAMSRPEAHREPDRR